MRLLIVNDDYLGYGSILANAFKRNGVVCDLFSFNERGIFNKILKNYKSFSIHKETISRIKNGKYTHVLILMGKNHWNFLELSHLPPKLYIYLYDDLEKYSDDEFLKFCSKIFTFNIYDHEFFKSMNYQSECLPLFFDDEKYFKINLDRLNEIVFVGATSGKYYAKRRKFLRKLSQLNVRNIAIYNGTDAFFSLKYARSLFELKSSRKYLKFKILDHNMLNEVYNSSRYIININADKQMNSVPMRIYEVGATGKSVINICDELETVNKSVFPEYVLHMTSAAFFEFVSTNIEINCDIDGTSARQYSVKNRAAQILKSFME